jgi:hypothetical protein
VEEVWFFVEAKAKDGSTIGRWYEVGEEQFENNVSFGNNKILAIQELLKSEGMTLVRWTNYHFHPTELDNPPMAIESAVPSGNDCFSHTGGEFYTMNHLPNVSYDTKIVTPYGLWALNSKKLPTNPTSKQLGVIRSSLEALSNQIRNKLSGLLDKCLESSQCKLSPEVINEFSALFASQGLTVQFTPLD